MRDAPVRRGQQSIASFFALPPAVYTGLLCGRLGGESHAVWASAYERLASCAGYRPAARLGIAAAVRSPSAPHTIVDPDQAMVDHAQGFLQPLCQRCTGRDLVQIGAKADQGLCDIGPHANQDRAAAQQQGGLR